MLLNSIILLRKKPSVGSQLFPTVKHCWQRLRFTWVASQSAINSIKFSTQNNFLFPEMRSNSKWPMVCGTVRNKSKLYLWTCRHKREVRFSFILFTILWRKKFFCSGLFGNSAGRDDGLSNQDRDERQRDFDVLNPKARHQDICGRRFVRQGKIVGGGIASYGEWPWQVSWKKKTRLKRLPVYKATRALILHFQCPQSIP